MNEIAAARSSIGISGDGKGVSGARRSGIPRCVEPPILGFAGLASDNRSIAGALNALIAALCVGMFMRQETNGESRMKRLLICTLLAFLATSVAACDPAPPPDDWKPYGPRDRGGD